MREKRIHRVLAALVVLFGTAAHAEVLVTKQGQRIETEGPWEVQGRKILFTGANGILSSIRVSEVDLEASEDATRGEPEPNQPEEGAGETRQPSTPEEALRQRFGRYDEEGGERAVLELSNEDLENGSLHSGIAGSVAAGAPRTEKLIGTWVGTMDDMATSYELKRDGSYMSRTNVMGISMISKGRWQVEGDSLVLNQTESIEAGERKTSRRSRSLRITELTASTLVMENEDLIGDLVISRLRKTS